MRSLASAAGMKSFGWQRPWPGRSQRTSASTEVSSPLGGVDDRLVVQEEPRAAVVERAVEVLLDLPRAR